MAAFGSVARTVIYRGLLIEFAVVLCAFLLRALGIGRKWRMCCSSEQDPTKRRAIRPLLSASSVDKSRPDRIRSPDLIQIHSRARLFHSEYGSAVAIEER